MTGRIERVDVDARPSDAPRPRAWVLHYRQGEFPTEFINPDQFSHEDGEPWNAPGENAIFGTYTDEDLNRREVEGDDFILYLRAAAGTRTEGAFLPSSFAGLAERLRDGESIVSYTGKYVPVRELEQVRQTIRFDRRFPAHEADTEGVREELRLAAASTGPNKLQIIQQAIFHARHLEYPQQTFIDPIIKAALLAALIEDAEG